MRQLIYVKRSRIVDGVSITTTTLYKIRAQQTLCFTEALFGKGNLLMGKQFIGCLRGGAGFCDAPILMRSETSRIASCGIIETRWKCLLIPRTE